MTGLQASYRHAGLWAPSYIPLCCCRPQMFVRAQSSGPEVDIDAPAVRATSFSDQLPTSAPVS